MIPMSPPFPVVPGGPLPAYGGPGLSLNCVSPLSLQAIRRRSAPSNGDFKVPIWVPIAATVGCVPWTVAVWPNC